MVDILFRYRSVKNSSAVNQLNDKTALNACVTEIYSDDSLRHRKS